MKEKRSLERLEISKPDRKYFWRGTLILGVSLLYMKGTKMDIFDNFEFTNRGWAIILPLALMLIDYLTGLLNAWSKGQVKSSKMRQGLIKKVGEIFVLIIGEMFVFAFNLPVYVASVISLYIIIMELISVFENLEKMGIPIPKFIKKALLEAEKDIQDSEDVKIYEKKSYKKRRNDNSE